MNKPLKIRDLTLRDGQQTLFSSRMSNEELSRLLPDYRNAAFSIVEMWGGDVPRSEMVYLHENPWERVHLCEEALRGVSMLSAVSRGRNLFGHDPVPEFVQENLYSRLIHSGVNLIRMFDSLNDIDNIREAIKIIHDNHGIADTAICYAIDPKIEQQEVKKGFLARIFGSKEPIPEELIFTDSYYVAKAREMEKSGAGILTLKDVGGLMTPSRMFSLMPKLKQAVSIPVDFHTHCTPGYGLASSLTAIIKGVDIIDTNIWWFAGGQSAPPIELIHLFCERLDIPVDVDMEAVRELRLKLKETRESLSEFDRCRDRRPVDFDEAYKNMPEEISRSFDEALNAATTNNESSLLAACHRIENYFHFPKPNMLVKDRELPCGMVQIIRNSLQGDSNEDLIDESVALVSKVRKDAGSVPLVAPTTSIIADQAVALALDRKKGNPDYTTVTPRYLRLVKGEYGKTPGKIMPEFRRSITGSEIEMPYDVSTFRQPANPLLEDGRPLAENEEDYILLQIFDETASNFLSSRRSLT